ncbi:hypothetical protein ACLOJK_035962 [Asimina triloba]
MIKNIPVGSRIVKSSFGPSASRLIPNPVSAAFVHFLTTKNRKIPFRRDKIQTPTGNANRDLCLPPRNRTAKPEEKIADESSSAAVGCRRKRLFLLVVGVQIPSSVVLPI